MKHILSQTYLQRATITAMRATVEGAKLSEAKRLLCKYRLSEDTDIHATIDRLERKDLVAALKAKKPIAGVTYK